MKEVEKHNDYWSLMSCESQHLYPYTIQSTVVVVMSLCRRTSPGRSGPMRSKRDAAAAAAARRPVDLVSLSWYRSSIQSISMYVHGNNHHVHTRMATK
jgi:hypothetical protein